jgi:hypothetical protein
MLVGFRLGGLIHHAQHFWTTGFQETPHQERGQSLGRIRRLAAVNRRLRSLLLAAKAISRCPDRSEEPSSPETAGDLANIGLYRCIRCSNRFSSGNTLTQGLWTLEQ